MKNLFIITFSLLLLSNFGFAEEEKSDLRSGLEGVAASGVGLAAFVGSAVKVKAPILFVNTIAPAIGMAAGAAAFTYGTMKILGAADDGIAEIITGEEGRLGFAQHAIFESVRQLGIGREIATSYVLDQVFTDNSDHSIIKDIEASSSSEKTEESKMTSISNN